MTDLNGKVAVVTGASSGIGAAIVQMLLKEGMKVVALARRVEKIETLTKGYEGQLFPIKADVTNIEDLQHVFSYTEKNVGPLEVLVNNAGIGYIKPIDQAENEGYERTLNTNLLAVACYTKEAIKSMKVNKVNGSIININSVAGHYLIDSPGVAIYHASKFGVSAFTESIRKELAKEGSKIRIADVSPGLVDTEMTEVFVKSVPHLKSDHIADAVKYILKLPQEVQVVGLARRVEKIKELGHGYEEKLYPMKVDVTNKDDLQRVFTEIERNVGPIDVLINNAGMSCNKFITETEAEEFEKVLNTNLLAVICYTKETIKSMQANNINGTIININSLCGHKILNVPGFSIYHASKFGVTGFTEAIRTELAKTGSKIRITSLSPGVVDSEMTADIIHEFLHIKSEDIANAIKFILKQPPGVQVTELTIRATGEDI